jgi:hypothetical protein
MQVQSKQGSGSYISDHVRGHIEGEDANNEWHSSIIAGHVTQTAGQTLDARLQFFPGVTESSQTSAYHSIAILPYTDLDTIQTVGVQPLTESMHMDGDSAYNPNNDTVGDILSYYIEVDVPSTPTNRTHILSTAGGSTGVGGANGINISGTDNTNMTADAMHIGNNNTAADDDEPIGEVITSQHYKIEVFMDRVDSNDMNLTQVLVNHKDILGANRVIPRASQAVLAIGNDQRIDCTVFRFRIKNYTDDVEELFLFDEGSGGTAAPEAGSGLSDQITGFTFTGTEGVDYQWVS